MITNPNKLLCLLAAAGLLCGTLAGCSKDPGPAGGGDGTLTRVTIPINVPGASERKSRALTEDQERHLDVLDLLLFEIIDATTENETYHSHQRFAAADINNTSHVKTVSTQLALDPAKSYRIVLLANAADQVDGMFTNDPPVTGTTLKKEVLAALPSCSVPTSWNGRELFMWGETDEPIKNPSGGVTTVRSIQLIRGVARLDVRVSAPATRFELTDVEIRHYNSHATVAPSAGNYSPVRVGVTDPTIAPDAVPVPNTPIVHTGITGNEFTHEIYLAEQLNAGAPANEQLAVYVAGTYNQSTYGWYKIDFRDARTGNLFDLLRNYRYEIDITEVSGEGASSIEDAEKSYAYISADIIPWNESTLEQDYQDDYTFDIDKTEFHFNADGRVGKYGGINYISIVTGWLDVPMFKYNDHFLNASTDDPNGWKVTRLLDENGLEIPESDWWVTLKKGVEYYDDDDASFLNADPDQAYIDLQPNVSASARYARMYVQAGKTEHIIRITQQRTDCAGRDGLETPVRIGTRDYKVHIYAESFYRLTRCWMTENLTEPLDDHLNTEQYILKQYTYIHSNDPTQDFTAGTGERGYYYNLEEMVVNQTFDPCPDGWHLPSTLEAMALIHELYEHASYPQMAEIANFPKFSPQVKLWFDQERYGGNYTGNGITGFERWGEDLYFAVNQVNYLPQRINLYYDLFDKYYWFEGSPAEYCTVRCVKDVD